MNCLVPSPPIKKLANSFPGETIRIITNAVGKWQEDNNIQDIDAVPEVEELKEMLNRMRNSNSVNGSFKLEKELMNNVLVNGELPSSAISLADMLGIEIKKDRRSNTITISSDTADENIIALFKALYIDAINMSDADELGTAMNMDYHERLDAILKFELNKKKYKNIYQEINPIIKIAKNHIRKEYGQSSLSIMDELRRRANEAYSNNTQERLDRVSEITEMFSNILTRKYEEEKDRLISRTDELNSLIENKDKSSFSTYDEAYESYIKELDRIQSKLSNITRLSYLNEIGPKVIFDEVEDTFRNLIDKTGDDLATELCLLFDNPELYNYYKKSNIQDNAKKRISKMLDNFAVLRNDACKELEVSELIKIKINIDENSIDSRIQENNDEDPDVEDKDSDIDSIPFKENWQYEFNTVSTWSKIGTKVRHLLYHCPRGGQKKTAFGCKRYVPVQQVIVTLLQGKGFYDGDNINIGLQGMTNSKDMVEILKTMEEDFPWISHILEEIDKDSQLKTQLFRNMRKTGMSYGILKRKDKNSKIGDIDILENVFSIINGTNSFGSIYTSLENNLRAAVPICNTSIFNEDGLSSKNISKINDIVEELLYDEIQEMSTSDVKSLLKENNSELSKKISNVLQSIGFVIDEKAIETIAGENLQKHAKLQYAKNNIGFIIQNVKNILDYINDNNLTSTEEFLDASNDSGARDIMYFYRDIAKTLVLFDSGIVEPSVRENSKSYYSFVLPSALDDLITGLKGRMFGGSSDGVRINKSAEQFILEKFGNDPSLYDKSTGSFRNLFLKLASEYSGTDYVTILDTDTNHGEKQTSDKLNSIDRMNIIWNMMFNNQDSKFINTRGVWFPIPTASDSGRTAFIRMQVPGDEEIRDAYKEMIIKELERMAEATSIENGKPVYNGAYDHLPDIFIKNSNKFCTFPSLNVNDKDGEHVDYDLLKDFKEIGFGKTSIVDDKIDKLVESIISNNREKFKEENEYFCGQKDIDKEDLDFFIDAQSVMQFSINEIINGDNAFYTGYNEGSDNQQKRAKQTIVPLDHIDHMNDDFIEDYESYHKDVDIRNDDGSVNPDLVVEKAMYIKDTVVESSAINEIIDVYDEALRNGVIDEDTYNSFVGKKGDMRYIKNTDGQCLRSFKSMKQLLYALGKIKKGDEVDQALDRIAEGRQLPSDVYIVMTAIKPFASGFLDIDEGVDDLGNSIVRRMPFQHKLSEQVIASALMQSRLSMVGENNALKAMSRFMENHGIDVIMFNSCVKVGNNGYASLDGIDIDEASEDEILDHLENSLKNTKRNPVHDIPYSLYGIVSEVPDDGVDTNIDLGTQMQKLLPANLPDRVIVGYENGEPIYDDKPYYVNGFGKMGASTLRSLYNYIMTERIKRAYHEVTGVFADTETLSKELQFACRNSSRNSSYLEHAFSLDENGNFVIPLCDMATMNLSSEYLNSIIRRAVTKIDMPGKNLVSMSSFGLHKKLKIEFEYDFAKDEDGNIIYEDGHEEEEGFEKRKAVAIKSIPCIVPAWSRHIIAKCLNSDGTIDMSKLKDVDERLFNLIGVRIPTQFKNFILPLKPVGFMPSILGDTIIVSSDIVVLQDADFDVDKIPTYFPSINASYRKDGWKKQSYEDFNEYENEFINLDKVYSEYDKVIEERRNNNIKEPYTIDDFINDIKTSGNIKNYVKDPDNIPLSYSEWIKIHNEDYLREDGPKIEYVNYDKNQPVKKWSNDQLNNALLQIMTAMLTSKAVATQSLASGSPSRLDNAIEKINKLIPKKKYPDSAGDISSKVQQEIRNNDGKNMIAVFAVATAIHSIAQSTRLSLNSRIENGIEKGIGFNLFGKHLTSLHDVSSEGVLKTISDMLGTVLGGAADNAKIARLNSLNINDSTASVASLLFRLGYNEYEVGLFLNIPSIKLYTSTGTTGDFEISDEYMNMTNIFSISGDPIKDAENAISLGHGDDIGEEYTKYNESALNMFMKLKDIGNRLHSLDMLSRGDSGSGAPHGAIENNVARMIQYELFEEAENDPDNIHMFDNWKDMFDVSYDMDPDDFENKINGIDDSKRNGNKLSKAFILYGTLGAYHELSKIYPGLDNKKFRNKIKDIIKNRYDGIASASNVKNVIYEMYNFIMSSYDFARDYNEPNLQKTRDYFINEFPIDALNIFLKYPFLQNTTLFKHLSFSSTRDEDDPFIKLRYDGIMTPTTRDIFTSDWQSLFYYKDKTGETEEQRKTNTEEVRKFASNLFNYCFFRNGFRFTDGSFAHLAPIEARIENEEYIDMLRDMTDNIDNIDLDKFDIQYLRNHMHEWKVCPVISGSHNPNKFRIDGEGHDSFTMPVFESMQSAIDNNYYGENNKYYDNDGKPKETFVVVAKINGSRKYFYYIRTNIVNDVATYILTTPLGYGPKAQEYDAKADNSYTMASVYDQSEVGKDLHSKKKKRKKNNSSNNKKISDIENNSNGSEEPSSSSFDTDELTSALLGLSPKKKKKMISSETSKSTSSNNRTSKKETSAKQTKKENTKSKKTSNNKSNITVNTVKSYSGNILTAEKESISSSDITVSLFDNQSTALQKELRNMAGNKMIESNMSSRNSLSAYAIAKKIASISKRRKSHSISLNFTGSRMNIIKNSMDLDSIEKIIKNILSEIKKTGIYVSEIVTTGQPGVGQAAAIVGESLGYKVRVIATDRYTFIDGSGNTIEDKDRFIANFGNKHKSKEEKQSERIYDSSEGNFIEADKYWTRDIVSKDKKTLYVFTDNTDRTSGNNRITDNTSYSKRYGIKSMHSYPNSTSAVIRGLENAYPISTQRKYSPGNYSAGRWNDSDIKEFKSVISNEINDIIEALKSGSYKRVVIPSGGFFSRDISEITKERCPKIYNELMKQLEYLEEKTNEILNSRENNMDKKIDDSIFDLDTNDVLTEDKIKRVDMSKNHLNFPTNIYKIKVNKILSIPGMDITTADGTDITEGVMFFVGDVDNKEEIRKSKTFKIYDSKTGYRILDDIIISYRGKGFSITDRDKDGTPKALNIPEVSILQALTIPKNKRLSSVDGFGYIDANNNITC